MAVAILIGALVVCNLVQLGRNIRLNRELHSATRELNALVRDLVRAADKRQFDRIEGMLRAVLTQQEREMNTLDDAIAKIDAQKTVIDGVPILMKALSDEVAALKVGADPATQAKIDALVGKIDANTQEVSDALVANTPAAKP